jgi:hypothetical protein
MNPKERLKKALGLQKQDEWQPYTGPHGGQGWINIFTQEVRYQPDKPQPEVGDGEEGGEAEPQSYEEAYEEEHSIDPEEDAWNSDLGDWFEEGEAVTLDGEEFGEEGTVESEVLDVRDDGTVEVDDPSQEGQSGMTLYPNDLAGESLEEVVSAEPPEGGFDSGWDEAPEDYGEIEEGQIVEVYDNEAGEYVMVEPRTVVDAEESDQFDNDVVEGDVVTTEHWEPGEGSEYEEGEVVTVRQDGDSEKVITTAEDLDYDPFDILDPIDDEEFAHMSEGDDVVVEVAGNKYEGELAETPSTYGSDGDFEAKVSVEDGEETLNYATSDPHADLYEHTPTDSPEDVLEWDGEMNWDSLDEKEAIFDHPAFDEVSGEVEISEDPQGNEWITIQAEPELEEGMEFEVNGIPAEIDAIEEEEGSTHVSFTDEDGNEYEWLEEDVQDLVDETEEASLSLDPKHPLYAGDHVEEVEDIWEDPGTPSSLVEMNPGSEILFEDPETGETTVETVAETSPYPFIETLDGTVLDEEQLSENVAGVSQNEEELPDVPWEADTGEWQGVGSAFSESHNTGDTVLFLDENGEVKQGEVEDFHEDGEYAYVDTGSVTGGDVAVNPNQVIGLADTGSPLSEPSYFPESVEEGSVIEGEMLADGEPVDVEGMVLATDNAGNVTLTDGENTYTLSEDELSIQDHDPHSDTSEFQAGDGTEMEAEEVVNEILPEEYDFQGHSGHGDPNQLAKDWFKSQKQRIRNDLKRYFDPNEVESFYDAIGSWKTASGTAQRLESAFAYAHDLESRIRDTTPHEQGEGEEGIPYSEEELGEWIEIAEVATEMSQGFYEDHIGEWYRGGHDASLRTAMEDYLENPAADSYELDGRALNNGDNDPQNNWNKYRIAPGDRVGPDDVMLATDFMFTTDDDTGHGHEDEIWVNPDNLDLHSDEIHVRHNKNLNFEGTPEEWDDYKLNELSEEFAKHATAMFEEIGDKPDPVDVSPEVERNVPISDEQLENLHTIATEATERLGSVEEDVRAMKSATEAHMENRGLIDPSETDRSVISDLEGYEPEDFAGETVPAQAAINGELTDGYIIDAYRGEIEFEDDYGQVHSVDMEDIEWVDDLELPDADTPDFGEGDTVDMPMFNDPVEVEGINEEEGSVTVVDSSGHMYTEDLDHPDVVTGEVVDTGPDLDSAPDPETDDTEVLEPEQYDTLEEGDVVYVEWPGVGDGKPAEVTGVEDDMLGLRTEDGSVTTHPGKDHNIHVSEGSEDFEYTEVSDFEVGTEVDVPGWEDNDWRVTEMVTQPGDNEPSAFWVGSEENEKVDILEPDQVEVQEPQIDDEAVDAVHESLMEDISWDDEEEGEEAEEDDSILDDLEDEIPDPEPDYEEGEVYEHPKFTTPVEVQDVDEVEEELTVETGGGYEHTIDLEDMEGAIPEDESEYVEFQMGDEINPTEYSVGEEIPIENYGGHETHVEVIDTADSPEDPVHLRSTEGVNEEFLYWPDGEVEEL